jgi:hypothetical protein
VPAASSNFNLTRTGVNSYTKAPPPVHTTASRLSVSSYKHWVAYNSTTGLHEVCTGDEWLSLGPNFPATTPTPVTGYASGSRPSAASNSGTIILNTTTGNYERSNGTAWLVLGSTPRTAAESILGIGVVGLPAPAIISGRTNGTKLYYDPAAGNNANAGTFASPKQTLPGTLGAGTEYLIKQGTTVSGDINIGTDGGPGNPVVLGVYSTADGSRVSTRGAATISGTVDISGDYVTLDGFVISGNPSGRDGKIDVRAASNVQVLNCRTNGASTGCGIKAVDCSNLTVQNCEAIGNGHDGIVMEANDGVVVSGFQATYNNVDGNGNAGIRWAAYGGNALLESPTIARNIASNHTNGQGDDSNAVGILLQGFAANAKIFRNTCRNNSYANIRLNWWGGVSRTTFDGLLIENNVLTGSAMSIHYLGVKGDWLIQRNIIDDAGSNDGGNNQLPSRYGRAVETFGFTEFDRSEGGCVRFNSIGTAFCFIEYLTEGIALGSDDNTAFTHWYGNWAENCEGSLMQFNTNRCVRLFANVGYNNTDRRPDRPLDPGHNRTFRSEIQQGSSVGDLAFGNFLLCGDDDFQMYGLADNGDSTSDCEFTHNTIVNARVAGASLGAGTLSQYNHFRGCGQNKVSAVSGAALALGAGETTSSTSATTTAQHLAECLGSMLYTLPFAGTLVAPVEPPPPSGGGGGGGYTTTPQTPDAEYMDLEDTSSKSLTLGTPAAAVCTAFVAVHLWNFQHADADVVSSVTSVNGLTYSRVAATPSTSNSYIYLYAAAVPAGTTIDATVNFVWPTYNSGVVVLWQGPPLQSLTPMVTPSIVQSDAGALTSMTIGPSPTLPSVNGYAVFIGGIIPLSALEKPNAVSLPSGYSAIGNDPITAGELTATRIAEKVLSSSAGHSASATFTTGVQSILGLLATFQTSASISTFNASILNAEGGPRKINRIVNALEAI